MKECYACGSITAYKWYHFTGKSDSLCGKCYHHYRVEKYTRQTNQVTNRSCYACGNTEPIGDWHINYNTDKLEMGVLCDICFQKYINKPRRIGMKSKRVFLGFSPDRVNRCEKCNKISKRLEGHHEYYYIIFPWAFRVYLCSSCHGKRSIELEHRIRDRTTGRFIKIN